MITAVPVLEKKNYNKHVNIGLQQIVNCDNTSHDTLIRFFFKVSVLLRTHFLNYFFNFKFNRKDPG